MNKKKIFESFINDPLLIERSYIKKEELGSMDIDGVNGSKMIQVIRLLINEHDEGVSLNSIQRRINQLLNS